MPTPFPGMDPYLEQRGLWEEVHTRLIVAIADAIGPKVQPRYRVAVEHRTYLAFVGADGDDFAGKPDVLVVEGERSRVLPTASSSMTGPATLVAELPAPEEVTERYLEIREVATGDVITVIELLSPSNKLPGTGRRAYEDKRMKVLGSATHLVEIDLIRRGGPMPMNLREGSPGDYRLVVSRSYRRPLADVIAFTLRVPIPDFPVPLRRGEPEPAVPLNSLLHDLYNRAGYDLAIDYRPPLDLPLAPEDEVWAQALVQPTG